MAWWLVALWFRSLDLIPVWYDQQTTFTQTLHGLTDPYRIPGFVYPPWTALLLVPFGLLPLSLAVLLQLNLYFAILTGLAFKFGGDLKTVVLALTSFVAFDSALELNIDWVAALGLLVPPFLSGPLLLVKPQVALGGWLGYPRVALVRAILVALVLGTVSLLVWGVWPLPMIDAIRARSLGQPHNLAPLVLLPVPVSLTIGLALAWQAIKRRDVPLSVLAWVFFVPYITFYSLLLHFTLLAVRQWRVALLISAVLWIVYGGTILRFFLHF